MKSMSKARNTGQFKKNGGKFFCLQLFVFVLFPLTLTEAMSAVLMLNVSIAKDSVF